MRSERRPYCKSGGYVMVLFALALAAFASLAGLAVDAAALYSWRLRVERASKAAAFSTLQYRAMRGWDYFFDANSPAADRFDQANNRRQEMLDFLRAAVANNLAAGGNYQDAQLSINGTAYDGTTDTLTLNVSYNVQSFIIARLLPLIGGAAPQNGRYTVSYQSSASLDRAAVALLLDVSGSMNCPNADCSCRVAGATGTGCDPAAATINNLVAALGQFKQFFNPFNDYIAVIPFNLAATTSFPIVNNGAMATFGGTAARLAAFNFSTSRAGLNPQSNTNVCDALIQAIAEFRAIDQIEQGGAVRTRKFAVLFSDGAPNAFHGSFNPAVTKSNSTPAGSRQNDWYEYALEWRSPTGVLYRGPGPLVQPAAGGTLFNHVISASSVAPAGASLCGSVISSQASFPRVLNANATGGSAPPFPGCLGNNGGTPVNVINFSLPGTGGQAGVQNVPLDANGGAATALNYARLPYYCAIEAADWLRTSFNAPVYTIGVGPSGDNNCTDPFENVDNPLVRKDNFLHRLAADPEVFQNPTNPTAFNAQFNFEGGGAVPACNCGAAPYLCTPDIQAASQYTPMDQSVMTPQMLGEYYGTANGNQLSALFSSVAKSILLRLGG